MVFVLRTILIDYQKIDLTNLLKESDSIKNSTWFCALSKIDGSLSSINLRISFFVEYDTFTCFEK